MLVFSCEVGVVKYAACMSGYLEAVLVWGIPCLLHECPLYVSVCQISAGMRVRLCMNDACPKPNLIWKWKMEYNSDLHNRTQNCIMDVYCCSLPLLLCCCCRKTWYLVSCEREICCVLNNRHIRSVTICFV